jgi:VanZ family protein
LLLHTVARKGAHLAEYGILAVLLYCSFLGQTRLQWRSRHAGCAFLAASLYAATDEFHQVFVELRGASVQDWMIDSLGAGLGLALLYLTTILQMRTWATIPSNATPSPEPGTD